RAGARTRPRRLRRTGPSRHGASQECRPLPGRRRHRQQLHRFPGAAGHDPAGRVGRRRDQYQGRERRRFLRWPGDHDRCGDESRDRGHRDGWHGRRHHGERRHHGGRDRDPGRRRDRLQRRPAHHDRQRRERRDGGRRLDRRRQRGRDDRGHGAAHVCARGGYVNRRHRHHARSSADTGACRRGTGRERPAHTWCAQQVLRREAIEGPRLARRMCMRDKLLAVAMTLCAGGLAVVAQRPVADVGPDYPIRPVPQAQVDITDEFWARKLEANRTVSIQHVFDRSEERGGRAPAQLIEAAGDMLSKRPDAALEKRVDDLIERVAAGIDARGSDPEAAIRTQGTFLEAAVAYYQATGKKRALEAAVKAADAIDASYGPGKKTYISGHEGLKIGLISLYRQTGDTRYRNLAKFFLDERGKDDYPRQGEYALDRTYAQDHAPVVKQSEAVGHAVRATYLYIPLADIAALTGRPEYLQAEDRIWTDAVFRKTYVTGAIGSIRFHEQFG